MWTLQSTKGNIASQQLIEQNLILTFLFNFCWSDSGQSCSTWWNDHLCLSKCFLKISDLTLIKQMKHPGHQCWFKFLYNTDIKLMEFCYWNYGISHDIWNQAGKKIHRFASDYDSEAAFVAVPNRACCWISHVTIPCTCAVQRNPWQRAAFGNKWPCRNHLAWNSLF